MVNCPYARMVAAAFNVRVDTVTGAKRQRKRGHFTTRFVEAVKACDKFKRPLIVREYFGRVAVERPYKTEFQWTYVFLQWPRKSIESQLVALYCLSSDSKFPYTFDVDALAVRFGISLTGHQKLEAWQAYGERLGYKAGEASGT